MAKVVILGGGIGGLSAAHELVERGFQVAVYEMREHWGGKARSYGVPGTGVGGRKDLPAEHGFRLFPSFYKHVPDTMKRIPYGDNPRGVFDNLVAISRMEIARESLPPIVADARFPRSIDDWVVMLRSALLAPQLGVPAAEVRLFVRKLLTILTSCQERRLAEYEGLPWWTFIEADGRSEAYQRFLADGLMRKLVAMQARIASTRVVGDIGIQLLLNVLTPGQTSDRVLNGPTNDVWIDPWVAYLRGRGVELHSNTSFRRLNLEGGRIRSATMETAGREMEVEGDYYIGAVPVEVMRRLLTAEVKAAAPSLSRLDQLRTNWMIGVQFYLKQDVPVLRGHVVYADSAWALTSISQHQFWPELQLSDYGDGEVQGLLSVDISDWHTPGNQVVTKPAVECTAEEILDEVWAQLKTHLDEEGQRLLEDSNRLGCQLCPNIRFPRELPQDERNVEPLLINTAGSWQARPEAHTEIPNLFLAADYVRTYTQLATMEGANEAARRAVNGILKASGGRAQPCELWSLEEPALFAPARAADYVRFKLGYGHDHSLLEPLLRYLPSPGRLSPAARLQEMRNARHFQAADSTSIAAPLDAVWELVAEPTTYPDWQPCYRWVRRLNDIQGVGASWEMSLALGPTFRLRFVLDLVRSEAPHMVEFEAKGGFTGLIGALLEATSEGTRVTFHRDVHIGKRGLALVSPMARPLVLWSDAVIMRQAAEGLRTELARRAARAEGAPRPALPAPSPLEGPPPLALPAERQAMARVDARLTCRAIGAQTGGAYTLLEIQDPPGSGQPPRRFHQFDGAAYVLEGRYTFQVGGRPVPATAGSLVFLPRGVWQEQRNTGTTPGRFLWIASPAGIEEFLREVSRLPSASPDRATLAAICRQHGVEMRAAPPGVWRLFREGSKNGRPERGPLRPPGEGKPFFSAGQSRVTFRAVSEETGGAYTLLEIQDPPGDGQPPRRFHQFDGAAYVLEGRYTFQVGGRPVPATTGSLVFLPRGVWHERQNTGTTPGRLLWIASPAGIERLCGEAARLPTGTRDWERLRETARKYGVEMGAPRP